VFQGADERPLAYEWLVEAREGGTCVVRLVNTGFGADDDWDDEYDAMTQGWSVFMENLRLQLTHFPGRGARAAVSGVMVPGPNDAAWSALCEALGVAPDLEVGDWFETADGVPPLAGVVQSVVRTQDNAAYLLLVESPAPGTAFVTAEGDGDHVMGGVYLYVCDGPSDLGSTWTAWLASRFEPVDAPATS
jgi:hypothetical protein